MKSKKSPSKTHPKKKSVVAKKKFKTLISEAKIESRIRKLGLEISKHYQAQSTQRLLVVGILKGSFIFLADLVRSLSIPCEIDFIEVSSYGAGAETSGEIKLKRDLEIEIKGRDVLLVEDIVDTGLTMNHLLKMLGARFPRSVAICSLLDKPSRRRVAVDVDFLGFTIEDHFVVGYGLDFNNRFRELSEVVIFDPAA